MKIDVSEVKVLKDCKRKWGFSSRNFYHMRSRVTGPNLKFGTVFHEALHTLYISGPESADRVLDVSCAEVADDATQMKVMAAMISGYVENVLNDDLDRFQVLDIEYGFSFGIPDYLINFPGAKEIEICGSIDMIVADHDEKKIYGFEHKTCANFRPEFYNKLDEQPRLYYIALNHLVDKYNEEHNTDYTNGGIFLNQVRKVQRKFEYSRGNAYTYSKGDCDGFLKTFVESCGVIEKLKVADLPLPDPGFMKCQMCDYKDICCDLGYENKPLEYILDEFEEEFLVRENDHLEEKSERTAE